MANLRNMVWMFKYMLCIIVAGVICHAQQSKPDLTLLMNLMGKFTCVAGKYLDNSAIYFTTELELGTSVSVYHLPNDQSVNRSFNCNFEEGNKCLVSWERNQHERVLSGTHDTSPILDARWEKIELSYTNYVKQPIVHSLNATRNVVLSVKSEEDAFIFLCTEETERKRTCFRFTISGTGIGVNRCENVVDVKQNYSDCRFLNETKTLNEEFSDDWKHIFIAITLNYIKIIQSFVDIMELEIPNSVGNLADIILGSANDTAWKIHTYSYLSLKLNENFAPVGARGETKPNGELCISLYATVCNTCTMSVNINQLENAQVEITGTHLTVPETGLQSWTNLILKGNFQLGEKFQLYFKGSNRGDGRNEFWAIDDIRECHKNGEVKFCPDANKIGLNCNISCNSILGSSNEYCGRMICWPSLKKQPPLCNCAAGLIGQKCDEECDSSHYGYNCRESCGRCKDANCTNTNGICRNGCEHGFGNNEKCDTRVLPILIKPPLVTDSTLTTITVQLADISVEGSEVPDAFQVQYKAVNEQNWATDNKKVAFKQFNNVTLRNLQVETTYEIRVILLTKNDFYVGEDISSVEAITTCKEKVQNSNIQNINVTSGETEISIKWNPICKQKYKVILRCEETSWCDEKVHIETVDSLEKHATVSGLIPYTNYSVEILDDNLKRTATVQKKSSVHMQRIQTYASAPGTVRDFVVYSRSEQYISLKWQPPFPPNGILEYYLLAYYTCDNNSLEYNRIEHDHCAIWPDYLCYNITKISGNTCYTISIKGKNKNVNTPGYSYTLTDTLSIQTPSEAPVNLLSVWENNELILNWEYPNITNGDLKCFIIGINLLNSELRQKPVTKKSLVSNITKAERKYFYKLNENIMLFSSSYKITVHGQNKYEGKESSVIVNTPPATPALLGDIKASVRSSTIQVIEIAGANSSMQSRNSYAFVVVCSNNPNSRKINENPLLKFEILVRTNCNNIQWIAAELQLNEMSRNFTVGDNSSMNSNTLNENLQNQPLSLSEKYVVNIVLINEYKDKRNYRVYSAEINEASELDVSTSDFNPALLALLLLLLLPVIGFFIYRYARKNYRPLFGRESGSQNNFNAVPLEESVVVVSRLRTSPKPRIIHNLTDGKQPLLQNRESNKYSRPVNLNAFSQYVKEALETGLLQQQHEQFPKGKIKPWDYGMLQQNKFKNRYNNITAYDDNRVKLSNMHGDDYSDFINASYIDGYHHSKAYIATQGPKPSTLNDFWRMIWQEKVEYIVMLANTVEGGKKKCEQYWPDINSPREFIDIEVKFVKSEIYADFEYRTFSANRNGEMRKVYHLHFTSWPDHGVPLYPQSLVPFLKKILTIPTGIAPIVVHCSAGVGRTGTIILCDICLRMAAKEGVVDVLKYLSEIRQQRANMVDNIDQYTLVHLVLLECLLSPDTNTPCDDRLSESISKLIEEDGIIRQMAYLEDTSWHDNIGQAENVTNLILENKAKNRYPDIVPERSRIYLTRYPTTSEHSDYINAVPVDGFRIKEQFIVTQTPLPNTVGDFWRMIQEQNVKVIVSLNDIFQNNKTSCIFWPTDENELRPVRYITLKYKSISTNDNYDLYNIQVETETEEENSESKVVHIIQFKNWHRDHIIPESSEKLLQLIEEAQNLSRHGNSMVVTCYDGAKASGIFVALSFVIEKIKLEQKCDVCLAVRVVRRNRKQFVRYQEQFEFLYNAALAYVAMFETYSNFQLITKK